jgi:hypothetical protein
LIERRKSNEGESAVAGSTSSNRIAWAKEHVDALDPFRHGVADPTAAGLNAHWAFNDLEDGDWALQNRLDFRCEQHLIRAAIEGRLPHGMGVTRLADLPAEWSRQHQMLGLPAR